MRYNQEQLRQLSDDQFEKYYNAYVSFFKGLPPEQRQNEMQYAALLKSEKAYRQEHSFFDEPAVAPVAVSNLYAKQPPTQSYVTATPNGVAAVQASAQNTHQAYSIPAQAPVQYADAGTDLISQQQPAYAIPNIVINNVTSSSASASASAAAAVSSTGYQGRQKDKVIALLLCFFLGVLGGHKFYEGKIVMGVIYLFTMGLLGFGALIDFIVLLTKPNPYFV